MNNDDFNDDKDDRQKTTLYHLMFQLTFFMTQFIVHRIFWMAVSFLGVYSAVPIV